MNSPSMASAAASAKSRLILLLALVSSQAMAQTAGSFLWARGGAAALSAECQCVAAGPAGKTFAAGYFAGTAAVFGTNRLTTLGTSRDSFVACYSPSGEVLWVRQGAGSADARACGIALDPSGDVLVTGFFSGMVDFDGTILTSSGPQDVFVVKYDSNGALLWARRFGGSGADQGNALAVCPDGGTVTAGYFNATLAFGSTTLVSNGTNDIFLAKLDHDGNPLWAKSAGGTLSDEGRAIGVDRNGDIYVGGYFNGTAYFESVAIQVVAPVNGTTDLFIAKYSREGLLAWVRQAGGVSSENVNGLALDPEGNVFITGRFFYTAAFGDLSIKTTGGGYPEDFFVAKYSPAGNPIWVRSGGGTGIDTGMGLAVDIGGNAFVGGKFNGSATFGTNTLSSSGGDDAFLAAYSATGDLLWASKGGGTGSDTAYAVAADAQAHISFAGCFGAPNATFGIDVLHTTSGADFFLSQLTATDPGTAPRITLDPSSKTVVEGTNVLFSVGFVASDPHFQWLHNAAAIENATNAVLDLSHVSPAQAGHYAVVVTNSNGAATSGVATLTVSLLPIINTQPASRVVTLGTNLTLSVEAVSGPPLSYRWTFNGVIMPGSTKATLSLPAMQYSQFGSYAVIVSSFHGSITSATALVTADLPPEVLWTLRLGSSGDDQALSVAVSGTNVCTAGLFSGTLQFGSSNLVSAGSTDVLLANYSTNATLQWVRLAGGNLADSAKSIAADPFGNFFVAGAFQSQTAAFGDLSVTNANTGNRDLFLAKYNAAGTPLWVRRAGGVSDDQPDAVATDAAGNAYITGHFYSAATFDTIGLTNLNYTNFFLAMYDPAGNVIWAKTLTGVGPSQGNGVTVDAATNVYVTGVFLGTVDFGGGLMTSTNTTYYNGSVFVAKYDRSGALQWARQGAGTGIGQGQALATDDSRNLYATAYKRDYGTGYLLAKYTENASLLWSRTNAISCCTGDATYANGLALDAAGNPILTGIVNGAVQNLTNYLNTTGYLLKYRSDGEGFWLQRCGTTGNSIARDSAGNLYVAGRLTGQAFFGPSTSLTSAGGNDAFLVKFGVRPPAVTTQPVNRVVTIGADVALITAGSGTGPLAYQWQFNGVNIPGATTSVLTLHDFQPGKDGAYTTVIQNTSGSVTSSVAVVTFIPHLTLTRSEDSIVLGWPGAFTLQTATNILGPFLDIPNASSGSVHQVDLAIPSRFYRLRSPW